MFTQVKEYRVLPTIRSEDALQCSSSQENDKKSFSKKQKLQTRTAIMLSLATLSLLIFVTICFHGLQFFSDDATRDHIIGYSGKSGTTRELEDYEWWDDVGSNDFSIYDCANIFKYTVSGTEARCTYANSCNAGQGLFVSFVFCDTYNLSLTIWCLILSPFLIIWLVLLFRMLGSTAEDFFSPSLEMFSMKMGLPPRFAGVTLLALGNGAADVSATISAIIQNPAQGYKMSLGALTGASMFVGTVVAGIVVITAEGVKCRGALIRDVIMLMMTVVIIFLFFNDGKIGESEIYTLIISYIAFVLIVLFADIYHRAIVLPRIRRRNEEDARLTQAETEINEREANNPLSTIAEDASECDRYAVLPTQTSALKAPIRPLSPSNQGFSTIGHTQTNGLETPERPLSASHQTGPSNKKSHRRKKRGRIQKFGDAVMVALSNYEKNEGKAYARDSFSGWGSNWNVTDKEADRPVRLHGVNGVLSMDSIDKEGNDEKNGGEPESTYSAFLDGVDEICVTDTLSHLENLRMASWSERRSTAIGELSSHFTDLKNDIFHNEDNNGVDTFFLVCELPFTIMRKLTIPIPCDGYYSRSLVALSISLSPLWIGFYAFFLREANLFYTGGFPYIEICMACSILFGSMFLTFAPSNIDELSLRIAVPIALLGFITAATWIDFIATQLVRLLTFCGVVCGIPGSLMGLTVLAWGNSMGDLSANMTMAKKGLANMAITACFAGPVFNFLLGIGCGFSELNFTTNVNETEVSLPPTITVGFCFILGNCILLLFWGLLVNPSVISNTYGYVAMVFYTIYVIVAIVLQFYLG